MAGIYIHYPFCKSRCYYCDFYTITDSSLKPPFYEALLYEIGLRKDFLKQETIETIYFGGGTPSLLDPAKVNQVLETIHKHFTVADLPEITIEINPDDVSKYYAKQLKQTQVNRVSLGIQAFYNYHLRLMNRRHKVMGALKAVDILQAEGYDNISIDLIYGLPEMTKAEWEKTLNKAVKMNIQHISAYHLTYEEGTVFDKLRKNGTLIPPDEDISLWQFNTMTDFLENNDFIQYEISNFGKMGRFSKHNINYWQNKPYLGLGPAAHSFDGESRYWNISDISKYLRIERKNDDIREKEILTASDRFNEYLMTGLRTYWGIDLAHIEQHFPDKNSDELLKTIEKYIESGHIKAEGNKYYLTRKGMFISDKITAELFV
ncbi:radical SAM family heme chaperone HemW [Salinivirga cyanobacteriivorans]